MYTLSWTQSFAIGSIRETPAWLRHRSLKAGSGQRLIPECDEMEPPEVAVEVLGGDAAACAQEVPDPAVAAVDRLDVHRAPDPACRQRR